MSTMTKFLALMPLAVLGAACGGSSPVGPSNPLASDEGFATAPNASAKSTEADNCRSITGVNLAVLPSTHNAIVVEATYENFGSPIRCKAPVWTSNPRGVLTPQLGGFRVGVSSNREVVVTATAPNGVIGRITLQGRTTDINASTTVCKGVTGVELKLVASTTRQAILVEATYLRLGSSFGNCAAPAWTSDPRGALTPQKNAFRVGVSSNLEVVVTATAPNGMIGRITIHGRTTEIDASTTVCHGVIGVELKLVPSNTFAGLVVEAKYLGFGPTVSSCPAPAWTSNPRGVLTPQKDAFRVGVSSNREVVVTATTRNGQRGQIWVKP
jgi:hypothetical protein